MKYRAWLPRAARLTFGWADAATLSPGERKRWQLGAALHQAPRILLLDEPGDHLDGEARSAARPGLSG